MSKRAFRPTVFIHGIETLPNGETQHSDNAESWEVYLRKDYLKTTGEPFDTDREETFDNLSEAKAYARKLAREYQCEIEAY